MIEVKTSGRAYARADIMAPCTNATKLCASTFRTVSQLDASAAGSIFERGLDPDDEISKVRLHLDLNLLG